MRNFNEKESITHEDGKYRDHAIAAIFAAVTIFLFAMILGVAHFVYSEDKIMEQRWQIHQNRDTIHQLRLQVIELEGELEIKNHWEE